MKISSTAIKIIGYFLLVILLIMDGNHSTAQSPRALFSKVKAKRTAPFFVSSTYLKDSVYSFGPGKSIVEWATFALFDNTSLVDLHELTFLSRTGQNTIKIKHKRLLVGNCVAITNETTEADYYLDRPDTVNLVKIGDPEKPIFVLEIALNGSGILCRVKEEPVTKHPLKGILGEEPFGSCVTYSIDNLYSCKMGEVLLAQQYTSLYFDSLQPGMEYNEIDYVSRVDDSTVKLRHIYQLNKCKNLSIDTTETDYRLDNPQGANLINIERNSRRFFQLEVSLDSFNVIHYRV